MKKLFVLALLFLILVVGFFLYNNQNNSETKKASVSFLPQLTTDSDSNQLGSQTTRPSNPKTIIIPKIGVSAQVESVGLDSKNNMDVPKKPEKGGWYNLGYRPGEVGNSVIAGHLDKIDGSPAVFYNLETLKKGDEIKVLDEKRKEYRFLVTDIKTYPWDKFPLQEVFGQYSKARLNLITCKGTFDKGASNYSHRTVVYSELVP